MCFMYLLYCVHLLFWAFGCLNSSGINKISFYPSIYLCIRLSILQCIVLWLSADWWCNSSGISVVSEQNWSPHECWFKSRQMSNDIHEKRHFCALCSKTRRSNGTNTSNQMRSSLIRRGVIIRTLSGTWDVAVDAHWMLFFCHLMLISFSNQRVKMPSKKPG